MTAAAAVVAVCVVVTVHVSWLRKPDKLPLPYWMANAVPFFTYVLDLAELYLWCSTERKKENKKYDPLLFLLLECRLLLWTKWPLPLHGVETQGQSSKIAAALIKTV